MTWQWQGDEETGKDLRLTLELEPVGCDDGAGGRSGERGGSKGTSGFIHEETGAASSLVSRVSALSGPDDGRGASCPLSRVQSALKSARTCLCSEVSLATGGQTSILGLGLCQQKGWLCDKKSLQIMY